MMNKDSEVTAMATTGKRRRGDDGGPIVLATPQDLRTALASAITTQGSVEIAIVYIMEKYHFDLGSLRQIFLGPSTISSCLKPDGAHSP